MAVTATYEAVNPLDKYGAAEDVLAPLNPHVVNRSVTSIMLLCCLDVSLLALSLAFFAFGLTIHSHNKTSTASHPRLTNTLLQVSKYVSLPLRERMRQSELTTV